MELFRFTLDGTLLSDEPEGWDKITTELRRDKEFKGQLVLMDLTLFFKGGTDGHTILKTKFDCEGFCSSSTLMIEQKCSGGWTEIFDGILFFTLIKEYLTPCVLECKLKDNSFSSKIENNRNQKAYLNVARSKNDETITIPTTNLVKFFDPNTGLYTGRVNCWRVEECFRFIIAFMTDNEIAFVSDYFGTGGEKENEQITIGEQVRLQSAGGSLKYPFYSYNEIFTELNKKHNLGFRIELISGQLTMRIEPLTYFYNGATSLTLNNVMHIKKSVDTSQLYSVLKFGSEETIDYVAGQTDFPEQINFAGFKEEQYNTVGKCNIDAELNLVSSWIISSNVIQDVYVNGNTDYDDDIFIVETEFTGGLYQAIASDTFALGLPFFYNDALRNVKVSERWFGGVANSIALYLGNGNDEFLARQTDVQPSTIPSENFGPFPFPDDFTPPNNDPNNNYQTAATPAATRYAYISPAAGMYTFKTHLRFNLISFSDPLGNRYIQKKIQFRRYNSSNVLLATFEKEYRWSTSFNSALSPDITQITGSPITGITDVYNTQTMYLDGGDYVHVFITGISTVGVSQNIMEWAAGGTFQCLNSANGGGIYQTYDPQDFKAFLYEFDYPLTFAQQQTIMSNTMKKIIVNPSTDNIVAWIDNMKYPHKGGNTKFILNNSRLNDC